MRVFAVHELAGLALFHEFGQAKVRHFFEAAVAAFSEVDRVPAGAFAVGDLARGFPGVGQLVIAPDRF